MGKIILNSIEYSGGGNADVVHLTQAEYDALPSSKLTDDKVYMITDVNGDGSQFQPVIYSENEREIGVWVDGKPLYQRTFILIGSYSGDIEDLDIGINNTAEIKYSFGYMESDQNEHFPLTFTNKNTNSNACAYFFDSDNDIYLKFGLTAIEVAITIQYTKSTDQAGSGTWTPQGVPAVHYSTDEQVVGTWIDGSTLYEKVYILSNSITVGQSWVSTNIDASNFDKIISCKVWADNNASEIYDMWARIGNDTVSLANWRTDTQVGMICIQYTKTQGGA